MLGRRTLLRSVGVGAVSVGPVGVGGCLGRRAQTGGGTDETTIGTGEGETTTTEFGTPAFDDGTSIPRKYTCEGANVSPRLEVASVPPETESLAVVVDDPDAPDGTFTHWLLWDLPPETTTIPENVPTTETVEDLSGARQGENDAGEIGYTGPCPPEEDGPHTYRFTLYALESRPRLGSGATKDALLDATGGIRIDRSRFTGEFGR